jgi:hypothetical protein
LTHKSNLPPHPRHCTPFLFSLCIFLLHLGHLNLNSVTCFTFMYKHPQLLNCYASHPRLHFHPYIFFIARLAPHPAAAAGAVYPLMINENITCVAPLYPLTIPGIIGTTPCLVPGTDTLTDHMAQGLMISSFNIQ